MIFLLFLILLTSGVRSQDSCEVEDDASESGEVLLSSTPKKCSKGFQYFARTPSSKNQQTSGWCLQLIMAPAAISQKEAEKMCKAKGAQLSIFDNVQEQKAIFAKVPEIKGKNQFIRIDGYRKDKCKNDGAIGSDPDCRAGNAFQMKNLKTDPTYQLNNFYPGDPNYAYKDPNQNAEDCLTIWGNDQRQIDNSCLATPPQGPIRGVLCGKAPS